MPWRARWLAELVLAGVVVCVPGMLAQTQTQTQMQKVALLIGIDTYEPSGTSVRPPPGAPHVGRFAGGVEFQNLYGPPYDVADMRALLTSEKFGFAADEAHLHVLNGAAATRAAILAAINTYLLDGLNAGDTAVLYMSGHGSLRLNSMGDGQAFDLDGTGMHAEKLEGTLVTADAYLGADDITSRELRRIFNRIADKGIHLVVILDTCHSGGQARGAAGLGLIARALPYDPRDLKQKPDTNADGTATTAPEDRGDNPVLVFSAAQRDESAIDVKDATPPHGLFTSALIEALEGMPAGVSADDVYRRVTISMEHNPQAGDQQPALDGTPARRRQPLFGGVATAGAAHTAVTMGNDGTPQLDIGPAADVGPGSEFITIAPHAGVKLRVVKAVSVGRSEVEVVSPPGAKVASGDVAGLSLWKHEPAPTLTFYAGPHNQTMAEIGQALAAIRGVAARIVSDPAAERWTHRVYWNGNAWMVEEHRAPASAWAKAAQTMGTSLGGPNLDSTVLKAKLGAGAVVWFDAPLARELASGVLNDPNSAATAARDRAVAAYVLAGAVKGDGVRYAWYRRVGFDGQEQSPQGSEGCSVDSPYPLRTKWVDVASPEDAENELNRYAAGLARLDGWLSLQTAVAGAADFPYALAMLKDGSTQPLKNGDSTYNGEHYTLALDGSVDTVVDHSRWVYVISFDCSGWGEPQFPRNGPGGKFPAVESGRLERIPLRGAGFTIGEPYGTDTYVLLTTSTQIDTSVLSFDAMTRGGNGQDGPLARLLRSTSSGTRGPEVDIPTDWSVQVLTVHSHVTTGP